MTRSRGGTNAHQDAKVSERETSQPNPSLEPAARVAPSPREQRRKGRPLDKDRDKTLTALKPWEAEGMSRATWFRRQAEERKQPC